MDDGGRTQKTEIIIPKYGLAIAGPLCTGRTLNTIIVVCSTAHLSETDNNKLKFQAVSEDNYPWIFNTVYGFIIDLTSFKYPQAEHETLRGIKFTAEIYPAYAKKYQASYVHFDCDGEVIKGEAIYFW